MKTLVLFFCFTTFGLAPNVMLSQNPEVKIDNDKTLTVDQVFDLIMEQTDYSFIYEEGIFENFPKVRLQKGVIKASELLRRSLSGGPFQFELMPDNTVLIKPQNTGVLAQKALTGVVTDKDGFPLAGVNVIIESRQRGTSTDIDGRYQLVAEEGDTITFTYLGFSSQDIVYDNQNELNVVMQEDLAQLDEVLIVSTGYQEISRERATGSFSNVEEKVLDMKISQDILSKLEGEISGIQFDNEDGPTIRGVSTINANNDPLIVVDGFPITQGLNTINPNDIAKITVLKDAAAASIWGIRAANGVIVIVTKKGKANTKPTIGLSSNLGITFRDDYNDFKHASTESYLAFEKHKADNGWTLLPTGNNQPPLGKALETYLLLNNGLITQAQADGIINNLRTIDNREEFTDLFMQNSIWSQQNISISGGGESHTYRAGVTYNANDNLRSFKNNDRDEIIAHISNQVDITPKLTFKSSINFNTVAAKNNGMRRDDFLRIDQYQQILDANGNYVAQPRTLYQAFKEQKVAEGYPYNWDYNLKQEYDERNNRDKQTLFRVQTGLTYDVTDYLSLEGRYQYEWGNINTVNLFNENTYYVRDLINTYTVFDAASGGLVNGLPEGSVIEKQFSENQAHSARFQFNFDKSFNDGLHQLNMIGGYEVRQVKSNFNSFRKFGYDPGSLNFANIAFGERYRVTPSGTRLFNDPSLLRETEDRFISYYSNVAYTFNNRYTLSGSVRLDDANLFGGNQDYRNIPLYSIGAKWDVHKENFFNPDGVINKLSLRATYGSNGNVDTGTSPFLQATVARDFNTNNPYAYISDVKNEALRLEKTYVTNFGVDFGLFNSRLSGSLEYYIRKSEDLLAPVSISSTLGFNTALINSGKMENKGFDLSLVGEVLESNDFSYLSTLNFSYNKNELTEVDVPTQTINTYLRGEPLLDRPLRYLFSFDYAGLDANGDPTAYNENGDLIDVDGNNENGEREVISNVDALIYEGTTTPNYYGSWINTFNYKQLSLRILTTFKFGHVFRNTNILNYGAYRNTISADGHIHSDFENRWQNPGDETITDIPRLPDGINDLGKVGYSYYANGNQFVDSASHIRLREVILGYQLNNQFLKTIGFDQFGLSLQASNLAVFNFNKWNLDPESLILPIKPTYTLNITATF